MPTSEQLATAFAKTPPSEQLAKLSCGVEALKKVLLVRLQGEGQTDQLVAKVTARNFFELALFLLTGRTSADPTKPQTGRTTNQQPASINRDALWAAYCRAYGQGLEEAWTRSTRQLLRLVELAESQDAARQLRAIQASGFPNLKEKRDRTQIWNALNEHQRTAQWWRPSEDALLAAAAKRRREDAERLRGKKLLK